MPPSQLYPGTRGSHGLDATQHRSDGQQICAVQPLCTGPLARRPVIASIRSVLGGVCVCVCVCGGVSYKPCGGVIIITFAWSVAHRDFAAALFSHRHHRHWASCLNLILFMGFVTYDLSAPHPPVTQACLCCCYEPPLAGFDFSFDSGSVPGSLAGRAVAKKVLCRPRSRGWTTKVRRT